MPTQLGAVHSNTGRVSGLETRAWALEIGSFAEQRSLVDTPGDEVRIKRCVVILDSRHRLTDGTGRQGKLQ